MTDDRTPWWKTGVIYQIYPRSFMDADGDGVGDLAGIAARLDHLVDLGVDAVWVSPVYPSPMRDFGYDVADYCGIDPLFGTLEHFDALVEAVHGRGMKLLMDFVPSHSSDAHPWFREARASKDSPKRDWYLWADPAPDGGRPNNWVSEFGGPAWTFDEATEQYYLHIFLPSQPSLNWRNPDLRATMLDAMRFWYDRGVDGFRIDAVEHAAPDPAFPDNPPNPAWDGDDPAQAVLRTHSAHQPEVFEIARAMRAVAREYEPERLLVGEAYGTFEEVVRYYRPPAFDGFQLPFNFALIRSPWTAQDVGRLVDDYEAALPEGAWPNWVLGNHDRPRIATRAGRAQARVAAMLLLTLRGTPTLYQGEELGKEDAVIPSEMVQDPWGRNVPGLGRDPVRTPMAWEAGEGAGFTTGTPWLPIAVPPEGPVAAQHAEPGSILNLHRALLRLRRGSDALRLGGYRRLDAPEGVLLYERRHGGEALRVALNFTGAAVAMPLEGDVVLSTHGGSDPATLLANEGRILR
ncbi:alpha-amylase family glycosyl hydrolase [Jannaschia sp. W003]|uniref:alpha-amylase family glycosyl hydrolase n=1 Tax=Jannaschia sp. W003 TaxID=2867012 RepID=UPI0028834AFD|nr:alpha-amylase family glycosyl hydrolase [Jannaschia sp. W003]